MKLDLSRDSFRAKDQYTRVVRLQGRIHVDADANEHTALMLERMRRTAADLIGPHGAPVNANGNNGVALAASLTGNELTIQPGRYYIEGMPFELSNSFKVDTSKLPSNATPPFPNGLTLVYIEVWETEVTALERPGMSDPAFGGLDSSARAKLAWRIATLSDANLEANLGTLGNDWVALLASYFDESKRPTLRARAKVETHSDNPCLLSPNAQYRGPENQLYRIEVHGGGAIGDNPTFKWSRNNGSNVFGVEKLEGQNVLLLNFGRDEAGSLTEGDIVSVELIEGGLAQPLSDLWQVEQIKRSERRIRLNATPSVPPNSTLMLRRWDHKARGNGLAQPIVEGPYIDLEDGVQVAFTSTGGQYRVGDYWLIPARTATADVIWPQEAGQPKALPPAGVVRYRAPLASFKAGVQTDLRRWFKPLAKDFPL